MNKNSFLLIEIMVSIMILSISIMALMKLSDSNISSFEHIISKKQISKDFSSILLSIEKDDNKRIKTPLDFLSKKYSIADRDIKLILSENKYEFNVEKYSKIDLPDDYGEIEIEQIRTKKNKNQLLLYRVISNE